jgi:hypothetical protein
MSRDPCVQEDADLAAVAGACSSGPPQPQPSQSEVCVLLMQSTPTFTHTVCFLHSVQASSPTWFSYRGTSKQLVFQHSHDLDICRGQRQAAQKQACGCPASWRFWFIDDVSGANQTYHIPARSMQISILLYILIICINNMHACLCQANCNSSSMPLQNQEACVPRSRPFSKRKRRPTDDSSSAVGCDTPTEVRLPACSCCSIPLLTIC